VLQLHNKNTEKLLLHVAVRTETELMVWDKFFFVFKISNTGFSDVIFLETFINSVDIDYHKCILY
jgi:hypothetical protein